jgi:hypothetical protein
MDADQAAQKQLQAELYRQKIRQARSMTPAQRVLEGLQHSEASLRCMEESVRGQFPAASDQEVQKILDERIRKLRRLKGKL